MRAENTYPEIIALTAFVKALNVSTRFFETEIIHADLYPVILCINSKEYLIHVIDEYNDLDYQNELLIVVLCLRELELMDDSIDYKNWCHEQGIQSQNKALEEYYKKAVELLPLIKEHFPGGELNSFIPDLDFQLNAGAVQALRGENSKTSLED